MKITRKQSSAKLPNRKDFDNPVNQKKYFKIKRFVDEYMIDLSVQKAWRRCGYTLNNSQRDNAEAMRAFQRHDVQQMIAERMQEREKKTEITQEKVLNELALIAFQNLKDISEWDGNIETI
jgi:phage terminase small subunit